MTPIERSPGLPIHGSGLRAGGGERGLTESLDQVAQHAAEALSELYGGAPVTIRFNSDRLSGGAWLKTVEPDYIGGNAEVGINVFVPPDAPDAIPCVSALMRGFARAGDDWETDFAELEGRSVESVDEAIAFLREHAVTDFSVLTGRLETLLERKRAARERSVRIRVGRPGV